MNSSFRSTSACSTTTEDQKINGDQVCQWCYIGEQDNSQVVLCSVCGFQNVSITQYSDKEDCSSEGSMFHKHLQDMKDDHFLSFLGGDQKDQALDFNYEEGRIGTSLITKRNISRFYGTLDELSEGLQGCKALFNNSQEVEMEEEEVESFSNMDLTEFDKIDQFSLKKMPQKKKRIQKNQIFDPRLRILSSVNDQQIQKNEFNESSCQETKNLGNQIGRFLKTTLKQKFFNGVNMNLPVFQDTVRIADFGKFAAYIRDPTNDEVTATNREVISKYLCKVVDADFLKYSMEHESHKSSGMNMKFAIPIALLVHRELVAKQPNRAIKELRNQMIDQLQEYFKEGSPSDHLINDLK